MPFINSARASFGAEGRFTSIPMSFISARTFGYTGAPQSYAVPATGTYTLEAWGAQGGNSSGAGGYGGYVKAYANLVAGQSLTVYVGGQGFNYSPNGANQAGGAGWNGGGNAKGSDNSAGGGGGGTDFRLGGTALTDRILVAGGGAGGTGSSSLTGGVGGGLTGGSGGSYNTGYAGSGGTQTGGGNYGGTFGIGGDGAGRTDAAWACSGGGGGWYGGSGGYASAPHGSGYSGSGGGGSSYYGSLANGTTSSGVRSGNGEAKITPGMI